MSSRTKRARDKAYYDRQIEKLIPEYEADTGDAEWTSMKVAAWAIRKNKWERHESSAMRELAHQISRVARTVTFDDGNGNKVRKYHAYKLGPDQPMLWSTIETITPEHMKISINARRDKLVGGAIKAVIDAEHFNNHYNPGDPINVDTDLTSDVHEKRQPELYDDVAPSDDAA